MAERVWLLTGGSGQVGRSLLEKPLPTGVAVWAPSRDELDLAALPDLVGLLAEKGVTAIISSGAYTAVDKAESEPDLAEAVNGRAPGFLAAAAARLDLPLVHLSTDYVFSGDGDRDWDEDDAVGPTSVYGRTKLEGERAVLASGAKAVVLRTAWVVSLFGSNFVKTMLRLGAERQSLRVVADQFGNPTSAADLADAIVRIVDRLETAEDAKTGVLHFVNAGSTSWHGLAERVFERASRHGAPRPWVEPITTADFPTPARRPANSRLSTRAITVAYGLTPRPWTEAIDEVVDALMEAAPADRSFA